jgi:hypothetical protein
MYAKIVHFFRFIDRKKETMAGSLTELQLTDAVLTLQFFLSSKDPIAQASSPT